MQHSRQVLAIVHRTIPEGPKAKPAFVFGASLVYIPACQARTSLSDALAHLKRAKCDCVINAHSANILSSASRKMVFHFGAYQW